MRVDTPPPSRGTKPGYWYVAMQYYRFCNTSTQAPVHHFSFIMQPHEWQNKDIKGYLVEEQTIRRRQAPLCLPYLVLSGQRIQQHQTCARREHMLHEVQVKGGRVATPSQIVRWSQQKSERH